MARLSWRPVALAFVTCMSFICFRFLSMPRQAVVTSSPRDPTKPPPDTPICPQSTRLQTLTDACANHTHRHPSRQDVIKLTSHLLVDDKHKLIFCDVAKSGSTTWLKTLIQASGVRGARHASLASVHADAVLEKYGLRRMRKYNITERQSRLDRYYKFLVIRHPLERLYSAYVDKFAMKDGPFHQLGAELAAKYRDDRVYMSPNKQAEYKHQALFVEFVRYLRETRQGDYHWDSYEKLCHPCVLKWDGVLKLETIQNDASLVLRRLGDDVATTSLPVLHANRARKTLYRLERSLPEFENIRLSDLDFLYSVYGADMGMFGYRWDQSALTAGCGTRTGSCC